MHKIRVSESDARAYIDMTDGLNIFPTHTCFDDALDYIVAQLKIHPGMEHTLTLVHGIAIGTCGPHAGEAYAHGWVEQDGYCVEAGVFRDEKVWYAVKRSQYYRARKIQKSTRYSVEEAWRLNEKHLTYGPWEREYIELCGKGRRIFGAMAVDQSTPKATPIKSRCPKCSAKLEAAIPAITRNDAPREGSFTLCDNCGELGKMDRNGSIRVLTSSERRFIQSHPSWSHVSKLIAAIKQEGQRKNRCLN